MLNLLTRLLLWLAIGYGLWWAVKKLIPEKWLTWLGGGLILLVVLAAFIDPNDRTVGTFWALIALPLTPLGSAITMLMLSLGKGLKKVEGKLVVAALAVLWVSSTPLVARGLSVQAEASVQRAYDNQRTLCSSDLCAATDAVPLELARAMVIVGDNADAYRASNQLPSQSDAEVSLDPILVSRLNSAADVYGRVVAASPLVTVTAGARDGNSDLGQQLDESIRQRLINRGIPDDSIRIIRTGMDIRGAVEDQKNFLTDRQLFTPLGRGDLRAERDNRTANRVILVTPALSMRRAALAFENDGLQIVAWPTELYGAPRSRTDGTLARLSDLVPNVAALRITTRYWEELLASMYYYMRGWLPPFSMRWDDVVETLD
ncbi:MAG: ElyC/SanA/YdcF family protein [Leptolyngbya sp.]|nr:ElyC/SanA/YdcF family protein [Leptolyngbya sp.]